jgi:glycosyltransferase involved in cell wall biosynthesis
MLRDKLIADAKKRKIKNIEFIDPVPKVEVYKYILASDMGASVLIKNDTFKTIYSNKTFDYMSCKKPILLAIDGVSREMVEEADAGVFVEPENPVDFAEKIRFYMSNPKKLKQQGENGYRYAKVNFDRIVLAEEYIGHLKVMLSVKK